jgi:hypothetical protein
MKSIIILATLLTGLQSFAGYNGSVSFSSKEIRNHAKKTNSFLKVASGCLEKFKADHIKFYQSNCTTNRGKKVCLSKFYGDRRYSQRKNDFRCEKGWKSKDGKSCAKGKVIPLEYLPDAVAAVGFPRSIAKKLESTSCVGMAISCLRQAFTATGQKAQWSKVLSFTRKNGVGGTAMQHALQQLGWRVLYWNPETMQTIDKETKRWDVEELDWESKGWHNWRLTTLRKRNMYWYNRVDDRSTLVGFEKGTPQILYSVPFWVGIANTGYHVFPGTYEEVIEAHSTQPITAYKSMEFSIFGPMRSGGGPRWTKTQKYRSGLIALPPGY